jgi:hypothetical protein
MCRFSFDHFARLHASDVHYRTANRTLEEMDLLFASKSPFVWNEERHFAKLKAEIASGAATFDTVEQRVHEEEINWAK